MPSGNITIKLILIFALFAGGLYMFFLRRRVMPVDAEDAAYPKVKSKRKNLFVLGVGNAVACLRTCNRSLFPGA